MPELGANEPIYTVGEVIAQVNGVLKDNFPPLWVSGEISNFTNRGHWYFDIVDQKNSLHCCMWKGQNSRVRFEVKNGDKVNVRVKLEVYAARGSFSAIVSDIELAGEGQLRAEYERLKAQLDSEGLFVKRAPLPRYPKCIAVITGEKTAALQDIAANVARRYPLTRLVLIPSLVQGTEAPRELVSAVRFASKRADYFDVLLLTRGGGSFEDLNAFNNEALARAIFECPIPVVSAVGHEIDHTICDFVADLRVPTPSTAAEEITPDIVDIGKWVDAAAAFIRLTTLDYLDARTKSVDSLTSRLREPTQLLKLRSEELSSLNHRMQSAMTNCIQQHTQRLQKNKQGLKSLSPQNTITIQETRLKGLHSRILATEPSEKIRTQKERVQRATQSITKLAKTNFENGKLAANQLSDRLLLQSPIQTIESKTQDVNRYINTLARIKEGLFLQQGSALSNLVSRMDNVSPLNTLKRGYGIISIPEKGRALGHPVRSIEQVESGQLVEGILEDGSFKATVQSVENIPPDQRLDSNDV